MMGRPRAAANSGSKNSDVEYLLVLVYVALFTIGHCEQCYDGQNPSRDRAMHALSIMGLQFLLTVSLTPPCPMEAIEAKLASADEHLYWHELWRDILYDGAAEMELDYAIADMSDALVLLAGSSCMTDPLAANLNRIGQSRLKTYLTIRQSVAPR
jgi:hypothetical protein